MLSGSDLNVDPLSFQPKCKLLIFVESLCCRLCFLYLYFFYYDCAIFPYMR